MFHRITCESHHKQWCYSQIWHHIETVILWITIYFQFLNVVGKSEATTSNADESPNVKQCIPRGNIVFIKTVKTGGSTMTNILSRFVMKHNLNIYPYLIHQKLHFNSTHLGKSNIFSDHFKYKRKTFADITSDDVIYWKGSSWQLGCVFSNVRNISLLWSSALKLAKKFNSTSFNLKQEVFIRRDEEKTRRGLIYIGEVLDTYFGSKSLNCENNLHTFSGGSVIFEQSHIVWRAVAIKLQHVWTCLSHSWGDEGMRLLNSCQVLKSLGLYWILVANNSIGDQLNRFLALQALV